MADAGDVRRVALALDGVEEIDTAGSRSAGSLGADSRSAGSVGPDSRSAGSLGAGFDFRVNGRGFVWSYPERVPGKRRVLRSDIAVLYIGDEAERQALLLGEPDLFFSTPSYERMPLVMVRLDKVDVDRLTELVTDAWHMRAHG
ncbi:MAG: hypothetical protein L0I76_07555 [Pseudonocardia sp.]|nr:hypothetical protein [Pseudonocardia sp.]